MSFEELFREKYRIARNAARANNQDATLAGLSDLYRLFANQFALDNGDSIVTKAKLSYWQEVFGGYIDIIRKNGLGDRRVQKFFGMIDDKNLPSFSDLMKGADRFATKSDKNIPDIAGLTEPEFIDKPKQPETVKPVEPVVPEAETKPELPQAPKAADGVDAKEIPIEPLTPKDELTPETSQVPDESGKEKTGPTFDPDTLENFIGQQRIVKALLKEIAIAKAQGRKYLDNILLLGNPGLGKTTLMRLIAKALGVRFEWMDCSQYRNSQQSLKALQNFLMKVARDNEPVVIALDEIHMLSEPLQSSLLTLLNSRVYVSPPDVNGVIKSIPIDNFTFIAATTNDNDVLSTIKDRCLRLKFQMEDYTPEELKRIYQNKVAAMELTITEEAIDACIPRSRGSIRYVDAYVKGLNTELYNDQGQRVSTNIDSDIVAKYFKEKGIDAMGLEKKDLEILRVLEEAPNGTMGAETLAARIGLDVKKYLSEYEPYLTKIGFLDVVNRGRIITEKGIKYLKEGQII